MTNYSEKQLVEPSLRIIASKFLPSIHLEKSLITSALINSIWFFFSYLSLFDFIKSSTISTPRYNLNWSAISLFGSY